MIPNGISRDADVSKRALAVGGTGGSTSNPRNHRIPFSSDVKILSNPDLDPTLIVDANGNIVTATGGITVRTAANANQTTGYIDDPIIVVNDVASTQGGQVYFLNPTAQPNNQSIVPSMTGSTGTWEFLNTLGAVKITNYSAKPLLINNITAAKSGAGTNYDVYLQSNSSNLTLTFDLARSSEPTDVKIRNLDPLQTPSDIILNGQIDNPIGTTLIENVRGSIYSTKVRGSTTPDPRYSTIVGPDTRQSFVRSNILTMLAPVGNIGDGAKRINVNLVESVVGKRDVALRAVRHTHLKADAGINVYLDELGEMRHTEGV